MKRPTELARVLKRRFEATRKSFLVAFTDGELGRWYAIEGGPLESYIEIREEIRLDTESQFGIQPGFPMPINRPSSSLSTWVFEVKIASSRLTERSGSSYRNSLNQYPQGSDLLTGLKLFKCGPTSVSLCLFDTLEAAIKVGLERDVIVEMMNAIVVHQVMKS